MRGTGAGDSNILNPAGWEMKCKKMERPNRVQVQLAVLVFLLTLLSAETNSSYIEHQMTWQEQPNLAADFSAFYNGAWSFLNDPGHVYARADYPVPYGQILVYPPHFLLFVIPLLAFSFPTAEFIFSAAQFALLPVIALVIYLIFRPKSGVEYALVAFVLELVLLEPFDSRYVGIAIWPQVQQYIALFFLLPIVPYVAYQALSSKSKRVSLLCFVALGALLFWLAAGKGEYGAPNYAVFSEPFATQWLLGQTKVLELALILLAVWLAGRKPTLSAGVLFLSAFDPRFVLLALPMYLYIIIKNKSLRKMAIGGALAVLVLVIPFVLYQGVFLQYSSWILNHYLSPTGSRRIYLFNLFDYDWLLFYALLGVQAGFALLEVLRSERTASWSKRLEDRWGRGDAPEAGAGGPGAGAKLGKESAAPSTAGVQGEARESRSHKPVWTFPKGDFDKEKKPIIAASHRYLEKDFRPTDQAACRESLGFIPRTGLTSSTCRAKLRKAAPEAGVPVRPRPPRLSASETRKAYSPRGTSVVFRADLEVSGCESGQS
jgi:hypothetical protein